MKRTALVIVTFKRQELLSNLLNSITQLTQAPWRIIVVDNENSSETASLVSEFSEKVKTTWGETTDDPDAHGGTNRVCYIPMEQNTGGSGGFSEGVRVGYELGAEWFWVMDDDVAVLPDGLDKLDAWSDKAEVIQGQRSANTKEHRIVITVNLEVTGNIAAVTCDVIACHVRG